MVNILRTAGLICSMIIASISLYFFAMFWVGIDSNIRHKKPTIKKSEQASNFLKLRNNKAV